jgi:hypothetical protein
MKQKSPYTPIDEVSFDARRAWIFWKKINSLSEWLWEEFDQEFVYLCNLEAHKIPPNFDENLPF